MEVAVVEARNHGVVSGVNHDGPFRVALDLLHGADLGDLGAIDQDGAGVVDEPASLERNDDPAPDQAVR